MPQKKNPYVLEELSVIPGRAIAAFAQDAVRWNRVSFGLATHLGGVKADPAKTVSEVCEAAQMLTGVVETLSINKEVMRERAGAHFTQASELADTLVREKGLSFRTAHRVIGTVVRRTLAAGKKPCEIDTAMIDDAAIEVTGSPIGLAVEVLQRALDPVDIVRARKVVGGTAPSAVEASLSNRAAQLTRDREGHSGKQSRVAASRERLEQAVEALLR